MTCEEQLRAVESFQGLLRALRGYQGLSRAVECCCGQFMALQSCCELSGTIGCGQELLKAVKVGGGLSGVVLGCKEV